jgi:cell division protein FtsL
MTKSKIKELEDKINQQQEEIDKLKKKSKKDSFWLFWLLKDKY